MKMKICFELSLFFIFSTDFDSGIGPVPAMAYPPRLSRTVLGQDFEPWTCEPSRAVQKSRPKASKTRA